jgi:16S rRNA (cytosine967-C5)-methyltransferase
MTLPDHHERRYQRQRHHAEVIVRDVLAEVDRGMPADATLARIFKQHPEFGSRDRRHYTHVVFSYFRWLGWTRLIVPDNLELQIAMAVWLDPASDDSYRQIWNIIGGLDDQFVLHSLEDKISLLARHFQRPIPSTGDLMPEWINAEITDPERLSSLIRSCTSRPPTWIRINPVDVTSFTEMLLAQQIRFSAHAYIPGAISIDSPFQLQQLEKAWGKAIQVQDIGSQIIGIVCDARHGELWWDACSGSGGKTLILAQSVGDTGCVLATDIRETILDNLVRRANEFRLSNITTRLLDASQHAPGSSQFDGVLIDAPCSGIGTWPRNPDAKWRITQSDVTSRSAVQLDILRQVADCVRPGGRIVYSVCTLTDSETNSVIRSFMSEHPTFCLSPFNHPGTGKQTNGEILVLPSEGPGDGMYAAVLKRK